MKTITWIVAILLVTGLLGWGLLSCCKADGVLLILSGSAPAPDTDAPTPNPATFSSPPAAISSTSIGMTATTGTDATGVEYSFVCTVGGGHDSGWQSSPVYVDSGLTASTEYTYTVQMRDTVGTPNVGTASSGANATTESPPDVGDTIYAGSGWGGATATPPDVNVTEDYNDATAIARWDVVPYQIIDANITVGVVAFHGAGIDRVSFSVEAGQWQDVESMTLNTRTNVVEYWVTLDAPSCPDGLIELRAIAYPEVGIPRVLDSLYLYNDYSGNMTRPEVYIASDGNNTTGNGTELNPYATPVWAAKKIFDTYGTCDGAIVYMGAGDYTWGDTGCVSTSCTTTYLTFKPNAGVARSEAVMATSIKTSTYLTHLNMLKMDGITIELETFDLPLWGQSPAMFWYDNCYVTRNDREAISGMSGFTTGSWATNCYGTLMAKGVGVSVRNAEYYDMGGAVVNRTGFLVNITVDGITKADGDHPDVVWWGGGSNQIAYNITAINAPNSQGMFGQGGSPLIDCAWVNCMMGTNVGNNQMYNQMNHFLIWHCTLGKGFICASNGILSNPANTNVSIKNSVIGGTVSGMAGYVNCEIDNLHFKESLDVVGTNFTSGDPLYNDIDVNDFSPGTGSPLLSRVSSPYIVPFDANNVALTGTAAIGALQQ